jgi:hypothetical protein
MENNYANQGSLYFEDILQDELPYVDKSAYFPILYKSYHRNPTFLARPWRFGKTLLLSSLDAFFSGRIELFRGLQAEEL